VFSKDRGAILVKSGKIRPSKKRKSVGTSRKALSFWWFSLHNLLATNNRSYQEPET